MAAGAAAGAGRLKTVLSLQLVALVLALALNVPWVGAQVHHVVGGDRGWDPSTDVAAWSSGRTFRVGDKIWFSYSVAQESIAEVRSKEEFEACDVSNPIRMYTDGIQSITLDGEGARYFASFKPENCKNGLKLHVDVEPVGKPEDTPKISTSESSAMVMAAAPATPSDSTRTAAGSILLLLGVLCCFFVGF